ncbi:unnamed protein product [Phytomonas sp. EM1]|nr:unnamed protein product [Phytomonas sp. EM1]|eukprot:CCW64029.1 unnamed protein product [Phytomonas sp. isolate EM1]
MQRPEIISSAVLEASFLFRLPEQQELKSELIPYLTSKETRDVVFLSCLKHAEEEARRREFGLLMLHTIPSFPPSKKILEKVLASCEIFMLKKTPYSHIYKELQALVESYHNHVALQCLPGAPTNTQKTLPNVWPTPAYIIKFSMQCSVDHHKKKLKLVEFPAENSEAVEIRPSPLPFESKINNTSANCKDYVYQFPLVCTDEFIGQQVGLLSHFWDHFRSNTTVIKATGILIKQICDGYVSKLPFGPPYSLLRMVSVCYLPTLFEWMESDYFCVRNNVYDLLLTLGMHLQLVDTKGAVYPGCTEALQRELIWILLNVVSRQTLLKPYDDTTWEVAAKCVLAIVPNSQRHLIDCRALLQFLRIPQLASHNPKVFGTLAESFAKSLLCQYETGEGQYFVLNENEFNKLGSDALQSILALYRKSSTVGAREAFFRILFACAVYRVQRIRGYEISSHQLQQCYNAFISLDLFWYFYSFLFYKSHQVSHQFATQLTYDLEYADFSEIYALIVKIMQCLLEMAEEDSALPSTVLNIILQAESSGKNAPQRTIEDITMTVPSLLREESSVRMYNVLWRLSLYCIRYSHAKLSQGTCSKLITNFSHNLCSFSGATNERERVFISRVCPDLITSLVFLGRTKPNHALIMLNNLLEELLFTSGVKCSFNMLLTLTTRLIEVIAVRNSPLHRAADTTDLLHLLCDGFLVVPVLSAKSLGPRILWGLYRLLCADNSTAACNIRYLLVCIIVAVEGDTMSSCKTSWLSVSQDSNQRVSQIGKKMAASNPSKQRLSGVEKKWK